MFPHKAILFTTLCADMISYMFTTWGIAAFEWQSNKESLMFSLGMRPNEFPPTINSFSRPPSDELMPWWL